MIDGSEKHNGWLNLEHRSLHVIERRSNIIKPLLLLAKMNITIVSVSSCSATGAFKVSNI